MAATKEPLLLQRGWRLEDTVVEPTPDSSAVEGTFDEQASQAMAAVRAAYAAEVQPPANTFTSRLKIALESVRRWYVHDQISQNTAVSESLEVNPMDKARMTFNLVAEDILQGVYKSNFNFYRQVNDNQAFKDALFAWLFERYLESRAS